MKLWLVVLFAALLVAAWTAEDYEIFKVNDRVRADVGEDVTFYSWLDVSRKATSAEINKAYRKLSRTLHPDKFRGKEKKQKEKQYQTLSVVGGVLKDPERRRRYDYFLDHGFPQWRGTAYLYSRFRPGIAGTLVGLWLLISAFHYLAVTVTRKQDKKRIASFRETIRREALQALNGLPDGQDRKLTTPDGKLFIVTGDGKVFAETDDDTRVEIHEDNISTKLKLSQTWFIRLPVAVYNYTIGLVTGLTLDLAQDDDVPLQNQSATDGAATATASGSLTRKKKPRGKKIKLPNGKVAYAKA